MDESLGKASLDLTANLTPFEANVKSGKHTAEGFRSTLEALAAVAKILEDVLKQVKMGAGQAAESKASAEGILSGVRGISDESRTAAREIDRVRIGSENAAESVAAGDVINRKLDEIKDNANETSHALDRLRLRMGAAGGGRNGVGVGPFGSGFGRIGVLGAAVGTGALTLPAFGPGAAGLLASIVPLASGGIGALGTLALAFDGVTKAIGGDKKAFDELGPSAKQFVETVRSMDDLLDRLRQTAAGAVFPGLTKGLKAALTPGTISAVTTAIREFGTAIGTVGAKAGKYLGSAEFQSLFGPLMKDGARNIGVLADAAGRLFDALGVLGRAAIPFTDWLVRSIDAGARLANAWLHAKDATGQLGAAMSEAKTSLRLVGGLVVALLRVVGHLGKALYPIAKVAVKDLTDGLNALSAMISRNQQNIRNFVAGALSALVGTVKIAWPIVRQLAQALLAVVKAIGGWKTAFAFAISGFIAFKFLTLAQRVAGIGLAAETAAGEVGGLRGMLLGLGAPEVLAAIAAAAAAYIAFRALTQNYTANPVEIGPQSINTVAARDRGRLGAITGSRKTIAERVASLRQSGLSDAQIKARLESGYSGTSGRDLVVDQALVDASLLTKYAYGPQLLTLPGGIQNALAAAANLTGTGAGAAQKKAYQAAVDYYTGLLKKPGETQAQKTAILQARAQYVQALATVGTSAFGADPPFTKNLGAGGGKPAVIPAGASHLLALASANASRASALGNVGKAADRFLNAELTDLQSADKLIKAKYESATGKARTQLFAALTSVENKMREVRKRLGKSIGGARGADLQFAIDQAKEAAAAATVGTAAWSKAISMEEKALRAQIGYLKKVADNSKLALSAREKAIRAVTADEKTLKALLKTGTVNQGANIAEFLTSFAQIQAADAPNASPVLGGGRTDTHLFDIKTETRQQTKILRDINRKSSFPASGYAIATAA